MPSQFTKVALGCQDAEHAREPLVAHGIGWMRLLTIGSGPSKLRECPPANLRDPHAGDFHRASTRDHALGLSSRHPAADEINKEIDGEPVCKHDRLAAAVGGCGEQFERAAALGLRAAPAA